METVFELCSGWSLPEVHLCPLDSLFLSLWRFHHFTSDIQHWCLQQRVNCGSDALVNGIQVGRVSIVQCVHFRLVQEVNVYALNQWPFTEWKVVNLIFNPTVRTPPWMSAGTLQILCSFPSTGYFHCLPGQSHIDFELFNNISHVQTVFSVCGWKHSLLQTLFFCSYALARHRLAARNRRSNVFWKWSFFLILSSWDNGISKYMSKSPSV